MADFLCGSVLLFQSSMIFLIVPLDEFGFKLAEIRLMTDNIPWDPPTKDNIVSCPYEMSLLSLDFV